MEFGRIKLPQGLHPNDLEEEWGKLILEMLEREKALRPAVDRSDRHTHTHTPLSACKHSKIHMPARTPSHTHTQIRLNKFLLVSSWPT